MSEEKTQWKKTSGLAKDSTVAQIVCTEDDLDKWDEEAEQQGYSSRSKYLYELILEARSIREDGFLGPQRNQEKVDQLQARIDTLEDQLENAQRKSGGRVEIDDIDFLEKFLADEFKPLDQLLREIVESGVLDDLLRKRVEDQLYFLASQGRVEFKQGFGWKLQNGGDQ